MMNIVIASLYYAFFSSASIALLNRQVRVKVQTLIATSVFFTSAILLMFIDPLYVLIVSGAVCSVVVFTCQKTSLLISLLSGAAVAMMLLVFGNVTRVVGITNQFIF